MKFRTIRRIIYLKKARHRRGHGIHSPFLFHLITEVVENRHRVSEYKIFKDIKNRALNLLEDSSEKSLSNIYQQFNLTPSNPHRLYRRVELPLRYAKVVFRLLREFKPSSLVSYGPSFGANFFNENSSTLIKGEFIIINYPFDPVLSRKVFQTCLEIHGEDDVVIIRGIHESKEMEAIWQEMIQCESVRVSLDLFEIGIALFRCRLQKENFIQRF